MRSVWFACASATAENIRMERNGSNIFFIASLLDKSLEMSFEAEA
jgi:hypothetical protein